MKNIHVLPTNKPSANILLKKDNGAFQIFDTTFYNIWKGHQEFGDFTPSNATYQNLYITSNEKIKKGDWCLIDNNVGQSTGFEILKCDKTEEDGWYYFGNFKTGRCKKIILTTNQDLIKDGVQTIDDEFLQWFVENPSCEEVETFIDTMGCTLENCSANPCINYKIIIPKESLTNPNNQEVMFHQERKEHFYEDFVDDELITVWLGKNYIPKEKPKQETLEKAAFTAGEESFKEFRKGILEPNRFDFVCGFTSGAKWQQERSYNEEDVLNFADFYNGYKELIKVEKWEIIEMSKKDVFKKWFEQFKKK